MINKYLLTYYRRRMSWIELDKWGVVYAHLEVLVCYTSRLREGID